ncbi:Glycoside hydrolase/deacetylase beta/alpha-barrel [Penicillium capsulatum]|uniref:Glycoside hydrolase/deacetylase beta/alpha-barrel n=1 Tax=Penicillium capsulatum TaxID=69766 RepID=A0A9W9IVG4_9EURO|nr:Glycoside hydrolase/deacetylase beta/alpha-barrel [Penicillium capsulatum]KAJ6129099.1 Glycoside hydrolase/deacetylase beta/alpha-barrel [Penicillium capsulatum]
MRPWAFCLAIPLLVGIVRARVVGRQPLEPATTQQPVDPVLGSEFGQSGQEASVSQDGELHLRDVTSSLDYRCGSKWGTCPSGTCCSSAGFCGTTKAHCRSPDCQIDFGNCDSHATPKGPPTKNILRPHIGKIPYGPQEIRSCVVPGTVALTFDDGPTRYTGDLLDILDRYEAPATFFITGINNGKGAIDDPKLPWASLIERMLTSGHQIASHTWSHEDLSKVTEMQRADQMEKNEAALRNIMGSFPTYMRPPYSSCVPKSGCREDLGRLGYHIILYDIDTDDYKNDSPNLIQSSKDIFDRALSSGSPASKSWLVIAHDAHEQTVHNLTEHMLKTMARLGYRPVTVGECLQDPRELWYRTDSRWPGHHKKGPKKDFPQQVSLDGTCGKNYTCFGSSFGLCCSDFNECGNSTKHCGFGCQKDAGYCAVEAPRNGDAWDPRFPSKSGKSEADSDLRAVGTAAVTSLLLALVVAMWM